jgi:hypothetical protein
MSDRADEFLTTAKGVLTTIDGATRLGGNSVGLRPWESYDISAPNGGSCA